MKKAIIGKKVGMTQIFDEMGKVIPVTVIEAGPCVVTAKMTKEKEEVTEKHISKPEAGHLKKAGVGMVKHLKEFKLENAAELNVGDVIKADTFAEGDKVDVTGTSKGHGYAGVIKRHGAQPPPATAAALFTVTQAPWAPAPTPAASSKARSAQVTWVLTRSPFRISMSSRSTPS